MKNTLIHDTLKFVDIDIKNVPKALIKKLEGRETYKDVVLKEHLYGTTIIEDLEQEGIPVSPEEFKFLQEVSRIDACYFRIINP